MVRPSACDGIDVRVYLRLADGAPGKRVAWMRACRREASRPTAARFIEWGGGEVLSKHAWVGATAPCGAAELQGGFGAFLAESPEPLLLVAAGRALTEPWLAPACLAQTNTGKEWTLHAPGQFGHVRLSKASNAVFLSLSCGCREANAVGSSGVESAHLDTDRFSCFSSSSPPHPLPTESKQTGIQRRTPTGYASVTSHRGATTS
jgi:hypothetical protein